MKVWITKYALTAGIIEGEAEQIEGCEDVISYQAEGRFAQFFTGKIGTKPEKRL